MSFSDNVLKDKSSPWSNFVLQSLKRFTAHMINNHNIETEKCNNSVVPKAVLCNSTLRLGVPFQINPPSIEPVGSTLLGLF